MKVTENDVELAERYFRALETIEKLKDSFTEHDVELAEKYADVLENIDKKRR